MKDEFIWVEKYRPKTIDDCILPEATKKTFKDFLATGEIPNLLLSGPPGIGKTTVAKALCEELGCDYYVINGSDEGRFLDTVRNQAKNFAATVSLMDSDAKHKVIIIDEADNTTHDVQLLLRANIESFYKNLGLSSHVTLRTESLNPSIRDAPSLSLESQEKINHKSQVNSSEDLTPSWTTSGLKLIRKSSQNSSISTSQIGEES